MNIKEYFHRNADLILKYPILTDIYNGDYTVKAFRNDVDEYFEPDDRGDMNR